MSCNSMIYTANTSNVVVNVVNDQFVQVPFGSVARRFGRNLTLDGGGIVACGSGYYKCTCSLTVVPTAEGEITAQLYQDGNPVPGAKMTQTAGAAGDYVGLSFPCAVRNVGCESSSVLSVCVNAPCTIVNFSCLVEKE